MEQGEIILEVERAGRRPRYHRGARQAGTGTRLDAPQCNVDQGGQVNVLERLPELSTPEHRTKMVRPWSQLCRRCWRGTEVLVRAELLRDDLGYGR